MIIARNSADIKEYMKIILQQGIENPVLIDKYMEGTELEIDCICDGEDVLIPGIMQHIERTGIHSGDSIAVYPAWSFTPEMEQEVVEKSTAMALALGTKGIVNIQWLFYNGQLNIIEANPRSSRTVPYLSKVSGVPMVELATRAMLGEKVRDLGFGTGLYRKPDYFAVKAPVFSFEKLMDVDTHLGPEMKSTGEVLGIGITKAEALFKGLSAAGFHLPTAREKDHTGVLLSVEDEDFPDAIAVAKRCYDQGISVYATKDTARAISAVGIHVTPVADPKISDEIIGLMENGSVNYIIYTGAVKDDTVGDYTVLHRKAMVLGIPCMTSLDTANALMDILGSRFTLQNTELVDINHMRH